MRLTILRPGVVLLLVSALQGCGPIANHFNLKGTEAFKGGDFDEAKKQFSSAVFWGGRNPVFHNNLGYTLYFLKDFDGAEQEYQKALSNQPDGSVLQQIKVDQSLLYCDERAVISNPSHKDWIGKGIAILKGLLEQDPNNAELHMRLGFAYFQATNPGGGFSELDRAVQLATPNQIAKYTGNAEGGALLILRQIQQFYIKIRLFKKVHEVQNKILRIERERDFHPAGSISTKNPKI